MSTYIVAYSNGPFEYLEGSYKSPLSGKVRPLRLYGQYHIVLLHQFPLTTAFAATSDLIDQAEFVMSVKERVLPLYEKVFDIEYPLPKLDTLVVSACFLTLSSTLTVHTEPNLGVRFRVWSYGELGSYHGSSPGSLGRSEDSRCPFQKDGSIC